MVKKIFWGIILFITTIFFINSISANYAVGNLSYSIDNAYSSHATLSGWVNISLDNEPSDSALKSSVGTSQSTISLMNLLNKNTNQGFVYKCNPLDCGSDYNVLDNGEPSKTLNLNEGQSGIIGFKITTPQPITDISSFFLNILSNNQESTNLPLSVDVLNDGETEWKANTGSGHFGNENQGCYSYDSSVKQAGIITTPYCEKITLTESPSVKIGANVIGSVSNTLFMFTITDVNGSTKGTCSATASASGAVSCSPTGFSPLNGDYYVCINAKSSADNNKYQINYEQNSPCGFSGNYLGSYIYDFDIFAQTETYAANQGTTLNNAAIQNEIKDYLSNRYNDNCTNGCVIPIKFSSGALQQVGVTSPSLSYVAGISSSEITLYNLEEVAPKLSSNFQKLYLDEAGFTVPSEVGNYTAAISLDGNQLFSQDISVETGAQIKYLFPVSTAVNYPTNFKVYLNSTDSNVTGYYWDFGDGSNSTTTSDQATHTYTSEGNYNLKVTVYSDGVSTSKIFEIIILPASEIVPTLLQNIKTSIDNLKNQTVGFSDFEQRSLDYSLKLSDTESLVNGLMGNLSSATSEADYESILTQLVNIKLPSQIVRTVSSDNILFYPTPDNIDLNSLVEASGGNFTVSDEDAYKNAILAWDEGNVDANLIYNEFTGIFDDHEESILKTFDVTFTKKSADVENPFIIIKNMDNLFFDNNNSQTSLDGYTYFTMDQPSQEIKFSTTGDFDFVNLPMFVSPNINDLQVSLNVSPFQKSFTKWIWFAVIVLIILILGIVTYILIRRWYKKKYETYLFKDRNNLYNLESYIDGEKKKGTNDKEIISKLKKAGWNSEQISYAMKKYVGKKIV